MHIYIYIYIHICIYIYVAMLACQSYLIHMSWTSQVSLSEAEGSLGNAQSQQGLAERALEIWLSAGGLGGKMVNR